MTEEIYSISYNDEGLCVYVGNTAISGVPSLEAAESFIELAKRRGITDPELIFDNQESRKLNLIGAMLLGQVIDDVIDVVKH